MSKKFVLPEMVSLAEYARRTRLHPQTIYQRLRSNRLPGAIKNADGDWRIPAPSSNVRGKLHRDATVFRSSVVGRSASQQKENSSCLE